METERMIWKPVVGFERQYEVSNTGLVRNWSTWNIVKPRMHKKGMYMICLGSGASRKTLYVHRIVAMAFIPNPEGYRFVRHKVRDRANNTPENLYWSDSTAIKKIKRVEQYSVYRNKVNKALYKVTALANNLDTFEIQVICHVHVPDWSVTWVIPLETFKTNFEEVEEMNVNA